MAQTPFMPAFEHLPKTLPIFPLEGAVVMPGADLPLNIFEPRYLNLVADAMASHRMFGMMQPDPSKTAQPEAVFQTGCAGRITRYQETRDGRIELDLTGICRFRIREELASMRGYRLVVPDWEPFRIDYAEQQQRIQHRERLFGLLKTYFLSRQFKTDWDSLTSIPPEHLVNALTTALPLGNLEKQALLEAVSPQDRVDTLIAALEMQTNDPHSAPRH